MDLNDLNFELKGRKSSLFDVRREEIKSLAYNHKDFIFSDYDILFNFLVSHAKSKTNVKYNTDDSLVISYYGIKLLADEATNKSWQKRVCKIIFGIDQEPVVKFHDFYMNIRDIHKGIIDNIFRCNHSDQQYKNIFPPKVLQKFSSVIEEYRIENEKLALSFFEHHYKKLSPHNIINMIDSSPLHSYLPEKRYGFDLHEMVIKWQMEDADPKQYLYKMIDTKFNNTENDKPLYNNKKIKHIAELYLNYQNGHKSEFCAFLKTHTSRNKIYMTIKDLSINNFYINKKIDEINTLLSLYRKRDTVAFTSMCIIFTESIITTLLDINQVKSGEDGFFKILGKLKNSLSILPFYQYIYLNYEFRIIRNDIAHGNIVYKDATELYYILINDLLWLLKNFEVNVYSPAITLKDNIESAFNERENIVNRFEYIINTVPQDEFEIGTFYGFKDKIFALRREISIEDLKFVEYMLFKYLPNGETDDILAILKVYKYILANTNLNKTETSTINNINDVISKSGKKVPSAYLFYKEFSLYLDYEYDAFKITVNTV